MSVRRLTGAGVVGVLVLLATPQVADAKTAFFSTDDVATTKAGVAIDIDVTANEHTGGASGGGVDYVGSVELVDAPLHGTATVKGLMIQYVPEPGFVGADALAYMPIGCSYGYGCGEPPVNGKAVVQITVTGPAPTTTTTTTEPTTTTTVAAAASTVPPTTVAVVAAADELPRTGSPNGGLALFAAGITLGGAGAIALSRRRRTA
jgi:LPXTG-motif cell wall-anchored protein